MISQLTVFLENKKGRLAAASRAISDAGINMHALVVADTADFGVARIFCDTPRAAAAKLNDSGFRANVTPVVAVRVPNETGSLTRLLEYLDYCGMNVDYGYCFSVADTGAIDVIKTSDGEAMEAKLVEAGFEIVKAEEVYKVD